MIKFFSAVILLFPLFAHSEVDKSRFFAGTSAFMLFNLDDKTAEPPHFYQFNFGYQFTAKDVLSLEFITWRYYAPLGSSLEAKDEDKYPGYASSRGAGLAYQRFLWRGLYTALHGIWFDQKYYDSNKVQIGSGKQLFLTFRAGYRIELCSKRVFIEPSLAVTHWPVNTGLPPSFKAKEVNHGKFQGEPGLHIGFIF